MHVTRKERYNICFSYAVTTQALFSFNCHYMHTDNMRFSGHLLLQKIAHNTNMFFVVVFTEDVYYKARWDGGGYLGKENTVPLRLIYRMDNYSQTTHDDLNTRIRGSFDSKQVRSRRGRLPSGRSEPPLNHWYGRPVRRIPTVLLLLETSRYSNVVYVFVSEPC